MEGRKEKGREGERGKRERGRGRRKGKYCYCQVISTDNL